MLCGLNLHVRPQSWINPMRPRVFQAVSLKRAHAARARSQRDSLGSSALQLPDGSLRSASSAMSELRMGARSARACRAERACQVRFGFACRLRQNKDQEQNDVSKKGHLTLASRSFQMSAAVGGKELGSPQAQAGWGTPRRPCLIVGIAARPARRALACYVSRMFASNRRAFSR